MHQCVWIETSQKGLNNSISGFKFLLHCASWTIDILTCESYVCVYMYIISLFWMLSTSCILGKMADFVWIKFEAHLLGRIRASIVLAMIALGFQPNLGSNFLLLISLRFVKPSDDLLGRLEVRTLDSLVVLVVDVNSLLTCSFSHATLWNFYDFIAFQASGSQLPILLPSCLVAMGHCNKFSELAARTVDHTGADTSRS